MATPHHRRLAGPVIEPRRLGQWHLTTCHRTAFPAKACVTRGTAYTACRRTSGYRFSIAVATSPAAPSGIAVEAVRAQAVVHRGSRARALPKTTRSKRSVPVARSVMRRLEQHLSEFCRPDCRCPCVHRTCGWPTIPLLGTRCLAAGRAACRVGRYNLPRTSAQLCSDHGGRGL